MPQNTDAQAAQMIAIISDLQTSQQYLQNAGNNDSSALGLLLRGDAQRGAKTLLDSAITRLQTIQTALAVTQATYTTVLTGANNDLVFTAVPLGEHGNGITITYADPGGTTATLGVVVTGTAIVVNLGRTASAIDTTATALKAAIDGSAAAHALVTCANSGADTGAGLVTAMAVQTLAGGIN